MTIGYVEPVAPPVLERAAADQRADYPNDGEALKRLLRYLERTRPMLADIREAVAEFYCIGSSDIVERGRLSEVALARQVFCYLAHKYTRFSKAEIGRRLYRHHTTVISAVRKIETQAAVNPVLADDLDLLRLRIAEKMLLRSTGGRA